MRTGTLLMVGLFLIGCGGNHEESVLTSVEDAVIENEPIDDVLQLMVGGLVIDESVDSDFADADIESKFELRTSRERAYPRRARKVMHRLDNNGSNTLSLREWMDPQTIRYTAKEIGVSPSVIGYRRSMMFHICAGADSKLGMSELTALLKTARFEFIKAANPNLVLVERLRRRQNLSEAEAYSRLSKQRWAGVYRHLGMYDGNHDRQISPGEWTNIVAHWSTNPKRKKNLETLMANCK